MADVQPAAPPAAPAPTTVVLEQPLRSNETHQPARDAIADRLRARSGEAQPEPKPDAPDRPKQPEAKPQESEPKPEAEAATPDEGVELADTLEGVAEQLGISVDDLLARKTTRKVNGVDQVITVGDALKSTMLEADYSRSKNELVEQRRQFEAAVTQAQQLTQQRFQALDAQISAFEGMLGKRPDPSLATTDPAGYVQQIAAWDSLNGILNQAKATRDAELNRVQQESQQRTHAYRVAQVQQLQAKLPELQTTEAQEKFRGQLYSELTKHYGYSGDEITQFLSSPWDHRMLLIARDAIAHRTGQAKLDVAQLKKLPPVRIKPLASLGKQSPKDKLDQAVAHMRGLPSRSEARRDATRATFSQLLQKRQAPK